MAQKYNVQQFIKENLFERFEISSSTSAPIFENRNLMLITRGNAASEILKEIINVKNSSQEKQIQKQYFRGSSFEGDRSNPHYPYQMLSKIILSMGKKKHFFFKI